MKKAIATLALCAALLIPVFAQAGGRSKGRLLYVPCSSHVYHGVKTRPFDLTVTLIVRNTDPWRAITVTAVEYYGTDGKLIRKMLENVATLPPMGAREFTVEQNDTAGGAGASFLVRWKADQAVSEAMAETVMIGTTNGQGISFTSRGVAIGD